VKLAHLGLPVADVDRSIAFYTAYFGFDPGTAQRYPDDTVIIRNADSFDLALHPSAESVALPEFLHFGFRLAEPGLVRELLARLRDDAVAVIESHDEPGYVSFKCTDPDGHRVETYWESFS
jgi:catechol 2,3-dioxygenase-like lactoylglutathione lyase family enzyme